MKLWSSGSGERVDSGDCQPLLESLQGAVSEALALAEAVAATFERVAGTYRRMADTARSPDDAARLLSHAARLDDLAAKEHAAARQFPHIAGSKGPVEE